MKYYKILFAVKALFGIIILSKNVYCQEQTVEVAEHLVVSSTVTKKDFVRYLDGIEKIDLDKNHSFLDTVRFEHCNEYFFVPRSPFVQLNNGFYIIALTGDKPCMFMFDRAGNFIKRFSRLGQGPGEMMPGTARLTCDSTYFYVSDPIEFKISTFNYTGEFVNEIRPSRKYASKGFKVSPVSEYYYYYNYFSKKPKPLFTYGSLKEGIINHFGSADIINSVAQNTGDMRPFTLNENGIIFAIKPEEYGFEIYSPRGVLYQKITGQIPDFFQPVSRKELKNSHDNYKGVNFPMAYFRNTSTEEIFYLGDNILMIVYVKWYYPGEKRKLTAEVLISNNRKKSLKFKKNIEFWRTDGQYLGTMEMDDGRIIEYAEKGRMYFWHVSDEPDENGIYPNPMLVTYDIFKAAGLR